MGTIILAVHIITCVFLIIFVLLQAGKGADAGATFGGIGQTYFGSQSGNILTKITSVLAVIFMLTSIGLTILYHQKISKSVVSGFVSPESVNEAVPADTDTSKTTVPPLEQEKPLTPSK